MYETSKITAYASRVEIGKSEASGKANETACRKSLKSIEVISATLAE